MAETPAEGDIDIAQREKPLILENVDTLGQSTTHCASTSIRFSPKDKMAQWLWKVAIPTPWRE